MPRKDQGWITFQTSEDERQLLEEICQVSQRTKTEVLRELLRGLKSSPVEARLDLPQPAIEASLVPSPGTARKPLKVSSRNVLKGRVKRIVSGAVNTEVTLEIVHVVELNSIITTTSAQDLGLVEGKEAYAVIKSNDVVIATE